MIDPTSGTVTVDGRDVAGVDPVKLRLGIGYVIQSGGLMPHQRVIDNVACVPVLRGSPAAPPAAPRTTCWNEWAWTPNWPSATRANSPEASSNASASPGHWPPTPRSC